MGCGEEGAVILEGLRMRVYGVWRLEGCDWQLHPVSEHVLK